MIEYLPPVCTAEPRNGGRDFGLFLDDMKQSNINVRIVENQPILNGHFGMEPYQYLRKYPDGVKLSETLN